MFDIAFMTAVLSFFVPVSCDLLAAGKTIKRGIRLPLNLIRMRVPPPVPAFIAAILFFLPARALDNNPSTMLALQDARLGLDFRSRLHNIHRMAS
jgi:hypothetical protein